MHVAEHGFRIVEYKVDADSYIEITRDELDAIALESTRTIEIDQFVPKAEIDELYLVRPYYIVPDGKVGHDAYAVIRETIRSLDKVVPIEKPVSVCRTASVASTISQVNQL